MNFCSNCGNKVNEGEIFCSSCGHRLNALEQNAVYNSSKDNLPIKSNSVYILLIISIIFSIVGCFLPILKVWIYSVNFVYNNGELADGILVVGIQIIALIALIFKNKGFVCFLQFGASAVFLIDFVRVFQTVSGYDRLTINILTSFIGEGFYVLVISLLLSLILSIVRVSSKDRYI